MDKFTFEVRIPDECVNAFEEFADSEKISFEEAAEELIEYGLEHYWELA